jgi:hypothetical protein
MSRLPFWLHVREALAGKTLTWLSEETEIPLNTIHGWISKGVIPPSDRGVLIAKALGYPLEYFVNGELPQPDPAVVKMHNSPATRRIVETLIPLPEAVIEKVRIGIAGILGALGYGKEEDQKGAAETKAG